ncbi:Kelch repeat-containing protein [Tieghemostelium lacteum]|uniref:Kelch repeat-containing protein n=1 Tax=Tieghemostelium lacteum TaxID=361077 RepID=A0A152A4N6_TIELA|nr:Kelch repeat-containing protein [Tieghemostelium lacteum]|eukprot:KYR01057.1 Kelch repeat-containing protein [Tieghemostelium lacteum]
MSGCRLGTLLELKIVGYLNEHIKRHQLKKNCDDSVFDYIDFIVTLRLVCKSWLNTLVGKLNTDFMICSLDEVQYQKYKQLKKKEDIKLLFIVNFDSTSYKIFIEDQNEDYVYDTLTLNDVPSLSVIKASRSHRKWYLNPNDETDLNSYLSHKELLSNLKKLTLCIPNSYQDVCLMSDIPNISNFSSLKKLCLIGPHNNTITIKSIEYFTNLKNLESFSIYHMVVGSESLISYLSIANDLKALSIDQPIDSFDMVYKNICKMNKLTNLTLTTGSTIQLETIVEGLNINHSLKMLCLWGEGEFQIHKNSSITNLEISNSTLEYIQLNSEVINLNGNDTLRGYSSFYNLWNGPSGLESVSYEDTYIPCIESFQYHSKCTRLSVCGTSNYKELRDIILSNIPSLQSLDISDENDRGKSYEIRAIESLSYVIPLVTDMQSNRYLTELSLSLLVDCNLICKVLDMNSPNLLKFACQKVYDFNLSKLTNSLINNDKIQQIHFSCSLDERESISEFICELSKIISGNKGNITDYYLTAPEHDEILKDDANQLIQTIIENHSKILDLNIAFFSNEINNILNKYYIRNNRKTQYII